MAKKKKSLLDQLVDIGVGTYETVRSPFQLLGTGLLAGGEALASGFDWDDREGVPFWNPEEAREGLSRGAQRYQWSPQTETGKAGTEAVHKGLEYVDMPFEMFGEGVEGITGSETAGDAAYWLTSLGLGPVKAGASLARKGAGALADKSQIYRKGWYSGGEGGRSGLSQAMLPIEMGTQAIRQGFSPAERALYRETGMARKGQLAVDDAIKNIAKLEDEAAGLAKGSPLHKKKNKEIRRLKRTITSDYSNQYVQKMIYDPANPAVAPGTPLSMANEAMFPHRATTTFDGLNTDPTVLSKALGMNVSPEIAAHIAPRIGQRFTRIQDNKPVILAHRTEGREITGGQMTGTVHGASTQPKNGVGHAWSNLMDEGKAITSESLLKEIKTLNASINQRNTLKMSEFELAHKKWTDNKKAIDAENARRKTDPNATINKKTGKPVEKQVPKEPELKLEKEYPLPKRMQDGDGLVSWEYAVDAGPDPLTASIDIVSVFNPRTGRIFEMSMDRMAPGVSGIVSKIPMPASWKKGVGRKADAVAEAGLKNHWISITPSKVQSIPKKYLEKHGLDDASLIDEVPKIKKKKVFTSQDDLTDYGRELRDEALEGFGESLVTGDVPKAPSMLDIHNLMSGKKPKIRFEDYMHLIGPGIVSSQSAQRKKRNENR